MKKKVLTTLLCVSLAATLLAGCGGGADKSANADAAPATDDAAPATDDAAPATDDAASDDTAAATTGGDYKFEIIVKSYQSSYWQAAVKGVEDEANKLGADAVINVRYGSSSVMQGAAEVIAYGTAVRYK